MMKPAIVRNHLFGNCQFAYTPEHSSRDAVLFMLTSWLLGLSCSCRVALYCSDVSGAFDNVRREILLTKIRDDFHENIIHVLSSWLESRSAQ
eukprot:12423525-Karenia_brevis.AAC.1